MTRGPSTRFGTVLAVQSRAFGGLMLPLPVVLACPPPADTGITVEVIEAGAVPGDWKQIVNSGKKGPVDLPVWVGVIEHPEHGTTLVDAGLGARNRAGEEPGFPFSFLEMKVPEGVTVMEQLGAVPDRVLLTHIHYDHVGGLFDMPGTEVWLTEADWSAAATETGAFPTRELSDIVRFQRVALEEKGVEQVLGRPAFDVLGDGTIWYLSLPGHTPGSAAVLVRAEGDPWLFIGDTAWVDDHLEDAERPFLTSLLVDASRRDLRKSLAWARELKASCPDLRVVAGHHPSE